MRLWEQWNLVERWKSVEVRGSARRQEAHWSGIDGSERSQEAHEALTRRQRKGRRMTGRACEAPFLCYRFAEERALAKQGGVQRGEARSRTV